LTLPVAEKKCAPDVAEAAAAQNVRAAHANTLIVKVSFKDFLIKCSFLVPWPAVERPGSWGRGGPTALLALSHTRTRGRSHL
jgi:hypothetical protein